MSVLGNLVAAHEQRSELERFAKLFDGLQRVRGVYDIDDELSAKQKKLVGKAVTKKEPVEPQHWINHLDGRHGLGIVPIRDDGKCVFGAIDVDVYDLDLKTLNAKVHELQLPLVLCRSKSGGAHLYAFFTEPVPAAVVQNKLREFAVVLGHPGVEIFPKQRQLGPDDLGNWINLPYHHVDGPTMRYALDSQGDALATLADFVLYAEQNAVSAEEFTAVVCAQRASSQPAAPAVHGTAFADGPPCLQRLWQRGVVDGQRNQVLYQTGIYLRRKHPDDWEQLLAQQAGSMDPPLDAREVEQTIKSLRKPKGFYKCNDEPFKSACDKSACLRRQYGVGDGIEAFSDEPADIFALPDAPSFNLELVPPLLRARAADVAERMGCNIENAVFPGIIAVGAAAGRDVMVAPKANDATFKQMPTLYGAIVQPSGMMKSPPANEMFSPIVSYHNTRYREYQTELAAWNGEGARPQEPPARFVTNTTTEALVRDLAESPGVLYFANELAGMLKAANQYKRNGSDTEILLELYDGYASSTRRKTAGNITLERACLGLYGTIQPRVAATSLVTAENEANGLMARFGLCAYPQPVHRPMVDRFEDAEARNAWDTLLYALLTAEWSDGGFVFTLANSARYVDWVNSEKEANLRRDAPIQTHCAKYPGFLARVALTYHLMNLACERSTVELDGLPRCLIRGLDQQRVIPAGTLDMAIALIDGYLRPHITRVYCLSENEERGAKEGRLLARQLLQHPVEDFAATAIVRQQVPGLRTAESVKLGMRYLDAMGWGRYDEFDQSRSKKRTARFYVNPVVFEKTWNVALEDDEQLVEQE
jgi:hypothetical protein